MAQKKITHELYERIRNEVKLSSVVKEYTSLEKGKDRWAGVCPICGDPSNSLNVSDEKRIYYCHSCMIGGDAFSFVMRVDGLSLSDAARKLEGML